MANADGRAQDLWQQLEAQRQSYLDDITVSTEADSRAGHRDFCTRLRLCLLLARLFLGLCCCVSWCRGRVKQPCGFRTHKKARRRPRRCWIVSSTRFARSVSRSSCCRTLLAAAQCVFSYAFGSSDVSLRRLADPRTPGRTPLHRL